VSFSNKLGTLVVKDREEVILKLIITTFNVTKFIKLYYFHSEVLPTDTRRNFCSKRRRTIYITTKASFHIQKNNKYIFEVRRVAYFI